MLRTRIITAVVLLAVLAAVLWSGQPMAIIGLAAVFFTGAVWEAQRLFGHARTAIVVALAWGLIFTYFANADLDSRAMPLFALASLAWVVRLLPALRFGLPALDTAGNRLVSTLYGLSLLACFMAILVLYHHSAIYLVSTMAIVWLADIGAYFAGKAFGRRKLAPSISPGKSWEGVVGGWVSVQVAAFACVMLPSLQDTFAAHLHRSFGTVGAVAVLSVLVAASVAGDLFESLLKRRVAFKDSSQLLPGHGGVLDRIDALVPVLPAAVLVAYWF